MFNVSICAETQTIKCGLSMTSLANEDAKLFHPSAKLVLLLAYELPPLLDNVLMYNVSIYVYVRSKLIRMRIRTRRIYITFREIVWLLLCKNTE
jgi:hypothetical protein